jgi:hypothetical protein
VAFVDVKMVEHIDLLDEKERENIVDEMMPVARDHDLAVDLAEDVLQNKMACTAYIEMKYSLF